MQVAGVDGCERGWLIVRVEAGERLQITDVGVATTFADVLQRTRDDRVVAIDVPIGLMNAGTREADAAARRVLGNRHSCVFPSVIRPVLGLTNYAEASAVSAQVQGKRIPSRAFSLGLRSHEVDQLMTPQLQQRVIEVHPEVCFWRLNNEKPVTAPKRTEPGALERIDLLSFAYHEPPSTDLIPAGAARDDFLDACAAAWTAARHARSESASLPPDPPIDARGLRMEIVY